MQLRFDRMRIENRESVTVREGVTVVDDRDLRMTGVQPAGDLPVGYEIDVVDPAGIGLDRTQGIFELTPAGESRRNRCSPIDSALLQPQLGSLFALSPVRIVTINPGVDDVDRIDHIVKMRVRQFQSTPGSDRLPPDPGSQVLNGSTTLSDTAVQSPGSVCFPIDTFDSRVQNRPRLNDDVFEPRVHQFAVGRGQMATAADPA